MTKMALIYYPSQTNCTLDKIERFISICCSTEEFVNWCLILVIYSTNKHFIVGGGFSKGRKENI